MKDELNLFIKDWYLTEYPDDKCGEDLNPQVSFKDLFDGMGNKIDAYEIMGDVDSIIRERVFSKLAKLTNRDYDDIYDLWLASDSDN